MWFFLYLTKLKLDLVAKTNYHIFKSIRRKIMKLLIIDPQNDFHDLEGSTLPVPGSLEDAENIAKIIERKGDEITDIIVTMDTHEFYDIAHQDFWVDENGNKPEPFTVITSEDIINDKFVPVDENEKEYAISYAKDLEEKGKEVLLIWPNHCIKGTKGWEVYSRIYVAMKNWEVGQNKEVTYYNKGTDYRTEHYGAFAPEVENEDTTFDEGFFKENIENTNEKIVIVGQALSHCVGETVRQIIDNTERNLSDFTLMTDCTSAVPGFEEKAKELIKEFQTAGINIEKSVKLTQRKGVKNGY